MFLAVIHDQGQKATDSTCRHFTPKNNTRSPLVILSGVTSATQRCRSYNTAMELKTRQLGRTDVQTTILGLGGEEDIL
jgi:hypothetical protein